MKNEENVDRVSYPLLVNYRDMIAGKGFVVGIAIKGRALLVDDKDEGFWIYGVNPGGISAGGKSQKEAASAFREEYTAMLFDIASEAGSFLELKNMVEECFHDTNDPNLRDWFVAVQRVRNGEIDLDLPREPADTIISVEVTEIDIGGKNEPSAKKKPAPSCNALPLEELAA